MLHKYQPETKTEIRRLLEGRRIKRIEFGSPDREIRSLALHLDNADSIVISATTWNALQIEVS